MRLKNANTEKFRNFQKFSELSENFRNFQKFSENLRNFQKVSEIFRKFQNFRLVPHLSRTCPGPVPGLSRPVPDLSRSCPGAVPDNVFTESTPFLTLPRKIVENTFFFRGGSDDVE